MNGILEGASLQTLFLIQYHILSISVSAAFPHCGYPSLQVALSLLKCKSGGWRLKMEGKMEVMHTELVVIRNIAAIAGLSLHLSCWSFFTHCQILQT